MAIHFHGWGGEQHVQGDRISINMAELQTIDDKMILSGAGMGEGI